MSLARIVRPASVTFRYRIDGQEFVCQEAISSVVKKCATRDQLLLVRENAVPAKFGLSCVVGL